MAEEKEAEEQSKFGKGLTYCLGLFLAHSKRNKGLEKRASLPGINYVSMWFNGAADHLFDLVIPETLPAELKDRLSCLQDKCLGWRLDGDPKEEDREWALKETKALLVELDKHFGIPTMKGQWE